MKKRMFSLLKCVAVCSCLMTLLLCLPSFGIAAPAIELKLGHTDPATAESPYEITAQKFASLIEQHTKGKYKVNIYPNNQLGSEREMIKNLTMGSMDLGVITNAVVGSFVGSFMALDLPFPRKRNGSCRFGWFSRRDASFQTRQAPDQGPGFFRGRFPAYDQQRPAH
jgi:TRAP-type C4-dicarboxylate transport system substrate-binding protein